MPSSNTPMASSPVAFAIPSFPVKRVRGSLSLCLSFSLFIYFLFGCRENWGEKSK
uniref:Uncharacterized protein n=1 Tax=Rhizophora mucronata TaxID=61149 RepID=A0A2P2K2J3_RHIMU